MKIKTVLPSLIFIVSLILSAAAPASAAYPEKPVNMIIAFTAGGSSDVQARIMQKYWDKYVKEPWVFIYKPGAGGIIGFTELAKAKADGYTIGGLNIPHLSLQSLAQQAAFNPESFDYIAQVVNDPQCVAVLNSSKFNSFFEIIDYAKANPNKLKVGLVGPLSGHHLMFLEFNKLFPDAKLSRVFYKGAADQNAALLGGEVDLIFGNINDVMRSIEEFKVLNIAGETRNDFLPDVPTLREQHIDIVSDIRRVFAAPKGIPANDLEYLREIFKKICSDPGYLADMKKAGQPAEYLDGAATKAYNDQQQFKAHKTLDDAGLLK
jgi:tripartite-type tricarboxylate transporter receptor subunit TctC